MVWGGRGVSERQQSKVRPQSKVSLAATAVTDQHDLARLLRQLRRREARLRGGKALTYRELASLTGWSHGVIGDYLTGKVLPPTDRFDALAELLGAAPAERGPLATARDRVEERRRATAGAPGPRPRELPTATAGFVGRAAELAELDGLLAGGAPATAACVISGPAGVGKTTLAVHWGHQVAGRFDGGQLYLDLRGFDPSGSPMPPAEALRGLLASLGTPAEQLPPDLDGGTRRYRSLLAGRRVLIVLDNARDADHVRPLLPGTPGCLALVTSRNRLTGLVAGHGAQEITLGLLGPGEARELLSHQLGPARLATDPAADELVTGCAGLPLALSIVGARAAAQPDFPLAVFAAQLAAGAHHRLDALDTTDQRTQVRTVFSWSYRQLSPAAARLFRLLGLHPGTQISAAAATSLAGDPPARVRATLAELTRTHLLTEPTPGRYALHDLLYAYATELAHRLDPDDQRRAAQHRLLDHYLHTAHTARYLLHRHNPLELAAPQPGVVPEQPVSPEAALAWFDLEHRTLLAAVQLAAGAGFDTHAWQLPWAFGGFLDRRGQWEQAVSALGVGLAAAGRLGDRFGEARMRVTLGTHYLKLRRLPDARRQFEPALDLAGQVGDVAGQAMAHCGLNILRSRQGQPRAALAHAEQALRLFQAAGHRPGQASAHNGLGWSYSVLGDYERCIRHAERALALLRHLENRSIEANTWDTLGHAHRQLGHHPRAVDCYQRSADLHRDCGDWYGEATALTRLGDAHRDADDPDAARDAWKRAGDILRELGHPDADLVRARLG
jgi:tetratricopeptide (TPR) repeat protein/transcriptional regulator with XRE-family HTH domain